MTAQRPASAWRCPAPVERPRVKSTRSWIPAGFEGALALPPASIAALDLQQTGQEQYATASGETYQTGTYRATVVLGERRIVVDEVIEAAEPLVGADLLWGFRVCVDYREDGRVTLEAL